MGYKNADDKRKYHREYMRERREWLKSLHLCSECGKQDAYTLNGRRTCFECCEKHRLECRKNYNPDKKKEHGKIVRQECTRKDLCPRCQKRPVSPGRKQCTHCLAYGRRYWKEKYVDGTIARSQRGKYGLCYICGNELDNQARTDGSPSKLCSLCYSRMPKPPKTRVLYVPFSHSENALENWHKVLKKREELLDSGVYDYIPIK